MHIFQAPYPEHNVQAEPLRDPHQRPRQHHQHPAQQTQAAAWDCVVNHAIALTSIRRSCKQTGSQQKSTTDRER